MLNRSRSTHHTLRSCLRPLGVIRCLGRAGLFFALAAIGATAVAAQVSVVTQHNDNARTGQNLSETILNTSNVKKGVFGKLFSQAVTGQIYGQPLYVPKVTIKGAVHNVVIVVTEQDWLYAFDADSNSGANSGPLWSLNLAPSGEEALKTAQTTGCTDTQPYVGVTATPVIDPIAQIIYVEAKTTNGSGAYFHRLHSVSLTTGLDVAPGPVRITGSASNGAVFQDLYQQERPGLLLQNGIIYLAYASHCDNTPYEGWIFAYDTATFTQQSLLVTEPNGNGLGGFWMAGSGIAADSSGTIYIPSGNGNFDTTNMPPTELGDTILKVGTTNAKLTMLDYFTASDQACLADEDQDLGSGGLLVLPDQTGATYRHIMVEAGKEGMVYVLNRDQLTSNNTHYVGSGGCTSDDPEILEESPAVGGMWSMPAYWNGNLYFWGSGDYLKSIPISNGLPNFSNITSGPDWLNFPGATPSISSNGTIAGTAIVWGIDSSQYGSPGPGPGPAVLHAFDATNVKTELWNSSQVASDKAGNAVKFTVPTIANGKVYIGTSTEVDVYGLLGGTQQQAATPVITPGSETSSKAINVRISDSTRGATIYYTTNGAPPTTSSTQYTGAFAVSSSETVEAIAAASGYANSAVASATYTITPPPAAPQISPASGTYVASVTVTLTDTTNGASIYYTTDGSRPSPGQGTTMQYLQPFKLTQTGRVNAIATLGTESSPASSATYRISP